MMFDVLATTFEADFITIDAISLRFEEDYNRERCNIYPFM